MTFLQKNGVSTAFHYVPLHSTKMGEIHDFFNGKNIYTTNESEKLLRLPMYYDLKQEDIYYTVTLIAQYLNDDDGKNADEKDRGLLGATES